MLTVRRFLEVYANSTSRFGGICERCVASWRHMLTVRRVMEAYANGVSHLGGIC